MVYRATALRGLAITQIVSGSLMIIFGIASIAAVDHWSSYGGFGLWIGVWVLISGILGYVGAKSESEPNKCLIGCFMGFSITGCVLTAIMFICYCVAISQFAKRLRCNLDIDYEYQFFDHCEGVYSMKRKTAATGAGLGSCLLIFSFVEFFIALASSISCCNAVCGPSTSVPAQQVAFYSNQQTGQSSVVIIPSSGQVNAIQTVYPTPIQQPVYIPTQVVPQMPPPYWAPGSVSYSAEDPHQVSHQAIYKQPSPPPYSTPEGGAVPPVASDIPSPSHPM